MYYIREKFHQKKCWYIQTYSLVYFLFIFIKIMKKNYYISIFHIIKIKKVVLAVYKKVNLI